MKVKIKLVDQDLPLPEYHTEGSVGFDIYSRLETKIASKSLAKIPTNLIIQTPPGYMLMIASRGSTPHKKGLLPPHGFGVGDQDFWGEDDEYDLSVYNFTDQDVVVERGERIAQGIFVPIGIAEWDEVKIIKDSSRGKFGSTGGKIKNG